MNERAIIHVDMDAFYASIEQHDQPALRGRPVIVGGAGLRGVVAAASYEARQAGVRSAMPSARARRLCPDGVFVPARFERYREVSREIFTLLSTISDRVEGLSLDEAFLDVSADAPDERSLRRIGAAIKRRIAERTGLTASVGMAHNKLLAKVASDYDKPDGLVHVAAGEVARFLDPLPVRRIHGIGPRTAQRLHDAGILTAGQLRRTSADVLVELFGEHGPDLARRAAGIDSRPVRPERVRKSISQETTFEHDLHDLEALRAVLAAQSAKVARRLAERGFYARTVTLKLRSSGFSTITRSQSLPGYTREQRAIADCAAEMLERWAGWRQGFAIRLLGVGVSGLSRQPAIDELLGEG